MLSKADTGLSVLGGHARDDGNGVFVRGVCRSS
jgi:hypothetical protein